MVDGLRDELAALGFTAFDIQLPGEDEFVAPLEGALRLRESDGYILETVDYGNAWELGRASTPDEARELVLGYVARPLPPVTPMTQEALDEIVGRVSRHYFDVRDRATAAGPGGIVIDLPADLAVDRLGALDGIQLYPIDTPFELRSLPPHVLRPESDRHRFLTAAPLRVGAAITPPWFGRPGGGLRFTLQGAGIGIRDLVVSGQLKRIALVD
ncbi:MAG: TNT domain-containing protein [Rhodoglobus sp.]